MEMQYSWWQEDNFYLGYLDEYPQYPTQGESLADLENGLTEIVLLRHGSNHDIYFQMVIQNLFLVTKK